MKNVYLIAAIIGAIVPYVFFVDFFISEGVDVVAFVTALFVNGAAAGFTVDLLITSSVFWLYMLANKTPQIWLYILINLTIGLSCALPLFLYRRELNKTAD